MIVNAPASLRRVLRIIWEELRIYPFYAGFVCVLFIELNIQSLSISLMPVTLLGTVVSFLITFRNNSAYDRWWEGRKIWGAIVNHSRSFGIQVLSLTATASVQNERTEPGLSSIHREFIYRHLAYVHALRMQLRGQSDWEILRPYLSESDYLAIQTAANKATQLNRMQAQRLKELREMGVLDAYRHVEITQSVKEFYNQQGGSERIKNTPFPQVYDFCTKVAFWTFMALLPFAMVGEFGYRAILFSTIVSLVFYIVIQSGILTQDPFENKITDVPLTAICRTIEIDLKQMLSETDVPAPLKAENGILM